MSLIRDALKKAQEEREKEPAPPDAGFPPTAKSAGISPLAISGRRMIIATSVIAGIALIAVLGGVIFKPAMPPGIELTRPGSVAPASAARTSPPGEKAAKNTLSEKTAPPETIPPGTVPPILRQSQPIPAPPASAASDPDESSIANIPIKTADKKNNKKTEGKTEGKSTGEENKTDSPVPRSVAVSDAPGVSPLNETSRDSMPGLRPLPDARKNQKDAPSSPADILAEEGDRFYNRQEFMVAMDRYKRAIAAEKRVSLYLRAYNACRAMNNKILAKGYIDDGLKHFPASFGLNKVAAIIYLREKQYPKALDYLRTALEQNDGDYALWTYKGLCHYHQNQLKSAMDSFRRSLDLNDESVENYYYIALIYDREKNYVQALEFYTAFNKLNSADRNFRHGEWVARRIAELREYLNVR